VVDGSRATPASNIRVSFELDPQKRHLYSSLQPQSRCYDEDDTKSIQSDEFSTYSRVDHHKAYPPTVQSRISQRSGAKALKNFATEHIGTGKVEIRTQTPSRIVSLKEIRDKRESEEYQKEQIEGEVPLLGEVGEPFWIQQTTDKEWEEPDIICERDIEKLVGPEDKKVLWEMVSLLLEFPDYSKSFEGYSLDSSETSSQYSFTNDGNCGDGIIPSLTNMKNPSELALIFQRKEYRVLWSVEAPHSLPLLACQDLVRFAYCAHQFR
jgi:hypothetical protein